MPLTVTYKLPAGVAPGTMMQITHAGRVAEVMFPIEGVVDEILQHTFPALITEAAVKAEPSDEGAGAGAGPQGAPLGPPPRPPALRSRLEGPLRSRSAPRSPSRRSLSSRSSILSLRTCRPKPTR